MSKIKYQTCKAIYNYSDAMVRVDLSTIIENVINSLKIENDRLKAELKQTNKDYNHDCKLHEELSDKQHDIILKLEEDIKEKEKQYHMLASSKGVDNGNL